ncbi:response regulator [Vibrio tritonius]|uniref:response regulator n=1 Tax=Vibrio tritonius TaxID=1435069 RepID=UPI00083827DE|nr:response regulator [Vibrio tritonius]
MMTTILKNTACDGFMALNTLSTQEFDVVLLDVQLPGMSGIEVARELKESGGVNQNTPLIALTANVQPSNINEYHHAGIRAVVSKPLKINKLYQAIVEAVNCDTDETSSQNISMIDRAVFDSHEKLLGKNRATNLGIIFAKSIDKIIPKIFTGNSRSRLLRDKSASSPVGWGRRIYRSYTA